MDYGFPGKRTSDCGNDPRNRVCPHGVYIIMVGCCLNQFCTPGCVRLHAHALTAICQWIRVSLKSVPRKVGMTQKIVCVHMVCTLSWWVLFEPILYPRVRPARRTCADGN